MPDANSVDTVVFLHGAGTGAWIWDRVARELGHPALALEVPGRVRGTTPDHCAAALAAELDRAGVASIVVVLHSLAGVLAPGLAAQLGPRLKRIVYLSGVVPPAGGSFVDALGFMNRLVLRVLFTFKPNGLKPSPAMIRHELCNDLEPADADLVVARYTTELPGLYLEPIGTPPPGASATYIKLLRDQSVPPALQESMIARLRNPRIQAIDAGHLAMLSAPTALAAILRDELFAAEQAGSGVADGVE